jgi:hypothetical protein
MKFLKTIRFDTSDDNVFENAAPGDEWAVSGGFEFSAIPREKLAGKTRQAFANAFLGTSSFGRSTFASVADIEQDELEQVERALAAHFVESYGAPDEAAALPAAREETSFIRDLCRGSLINTVFTVRRYFDDDGEIREEFRTIQAPSSQPLHSKIWSVVDDEA